MARETEPESWTSWGIHPAFTFVALFGAAAWLFFESAVDEPFCFFHSQDVLTQVVQPTAVGTAFAFWLLDVVPRAFQGRCSRRWLYLVPIASVAMLSLWGTVGDYMDEVGNCGLPTPQLAAPN